MGEKISVSFLVVFLTNVNFTLTTYETIQKTQRPLEAKWTMRHNTILNLLFGKKQRASLTTIYSEHLSWCKGLKAHVHQGFGDFNDPLRGLFPTLSFSFFSFSAFHSLQGEIPETWIRIASLRIHDLISSCHSELMALDTTSEDLKY